MIIISDWLLFENDQIGANGANDEPQAFDQDGGGSGGGYHLDKGETSSWWRAFSAVATYKMASIQLSSSNWRASLTSPRRRWSWPTCAGRPPSTRCPASSAGSSSSSPSLTFSSSPSHNFSLPPSSPSNPLFSLLHFSQDPSPSLRVSKAGNQTLATVSPSSRKMLDLFQNPKHCANYWHLTPLVMSQVFSQWAVLSTMGRKSERNLKASWLEHWSVGRYAGDGGHAPTELLVASLTVWWKQELIILHICKFVMFHISNWSHIFIFCLWDCHILYFLLNSTSVKAKLQCGSHNTHTDKHSIPSTIFHIGTLSTIIHIGFHA